VIPGLHEFFSSLTYAVSLHHPQGLGILFAMGILTDIGVPLLFTLEIFLLFASYYIGPLSIQVLLIILMLLLGRESGAAILFQISRVLGESFLNWLQSHFLWLLRGLKPIKARAKQHTTFMVIVVRLTPGFLQIPSVVSGSLRLKYTRFALGVAISSLIYDFSLVLFGFIARIAFKNTRQDLTDYFFIAFAVLIIIMWIVLFFRFHRIFDEQNGGD
jgi:membrane protein DedA with SNARE-associated domain